MWLLLAPAESPAAHFSGCYNVMGGIDKVIPVNVYVPGCPPRPEAIIFGVAQLLGSLKPGKTKAPSEPIYIDEKGLKVMVRDQMDNEGVGE